MSELKERVRDSRREGAFKPKLKALRKHSRESALFKLELKGLRKPSKESAFKTSVIRHTNHVFRWKLENFSKWPTCFKVTSTEFQPVNELLLHAVFERRINSFNVHETELRFVSQGTKSVEIIHQLSVTDTEGKDFYNPPLIAHTYDAHNKTKVFPVSPENLIRFMSETTDQILIWKCIMGFKELSTESEFIDHGMGNPLDYQPNLSEDFKTMFLESLYTDFRFLVESSAVRVHKSVLCARSPVFAKMLASPMDENVKDSIEITDIELPTLKTFAEYLYTGQLPPDADFESVCSLYYAADKYDVFSLRKICAGILLDKLGVENSCRVLSLANRHSDVQLKDLVLDFMLLKFPEILLTESWIDFVKTETELAVEVMRFRG